MNLGLLLVLCWFAVGRITRLVVQDDFPPLLAPRRWIVGRYPDKLNVPLPAGKYAEHPRQRTHWWLGELVTCPWCASGWVALATWLLVWHWQPLPLPVIWWPAIWMGGAVLAART
jgi:uncharacterized protein DUF1360